MSDSVTSWTIAHQAPLFMELPRQEYWSGLPFFSPEDLANLGIEPESPAWQVDSFPLSPHLCRWPESNIPGGAEFSSFIFLKQVYYVVQKNVKL